MFNQTKNERDFLKNFLKYKKIFFSQIFHIYSYGLFLAMYLWFVFFDILALHIIIFSFIVGFLAIIADTVIYYTLKKLYYDTFDFGKVIVTFLIFYLFQMSYFLKAWFNIEPQQLMLGYLIGYSQLKMTGVLATILKSVGSIALLLSFISCLNYARSGYSKLIPGWNKKVSSGEFVFLSFIVATINIIAALQMASYIKERIVNVYILLTFFTLASLLIIPTYKSKIKIFSEESPETKKMLMMIKNNKTSIIIDALFLFLSDAILFFSFTVIGPWEIFSIFLSAFVIIGNRYRAIGSVQRERKEEELDLISQKIFNNFN
ncbi:MAG: hypothetical protein ACTSSL_05770 [Candidatus Heimdallarchaeaceae archaeon]